MTPYEVGLGYEPDARGPDPNYHQLGWPKSQEDKDKDGSDSDDDDGTGEGTYLDDDNDHSCNGDDSEQYSESYHTQQGSVGHYEYSEESRNAAPDFEEAFRSFRPRKYGSGMGTAV
jgi:hypothetical protein